MARMSLPVIVLMSLLGTTAFAGNLPGQDINARASVSYYVQSAISASASVNFVDHTNAPLQSSSEPTLAIIESSAAPVSAGPATAFVAPDPGAPLFFTSVASLYAGPSMVGKRVKLAGILFTENGTLYLDDGANVAVPNPSDPDSVCPEPVRIALRKDLVTFVPPDGSLVMVQGVVRIENNGQPSLLPLDNSCFVRPQ